MDQGSESKPNDDPANTNANSNSQSAGPSQLACVPCRRKHLKCDAKSPVCTRCSSSGSKCFYTPSRRGYKGPSKRQRDSTAGLDEGDASWAAMPGVHMVDHMQFDFADLNNSNGSNSNNNSYRGQGSSMNASNSGLITTQSLAPPEKGQYLIDMYYHNFHAAHPILLPPVALQYAEPMPNYLELVMKFIGSHFAAHVPNDTYRHSTASAIANNPEKDAYKVQALLLFAIALHARNEQAEAAETLSTAVDLALELGMNREAFSYMHGGQDANREESLRRTWWELYIVDGMLAALHQKTSFKTDTVESDVPFPCEDSVYEERVRSTTPPRASQFYNRIFADEEQVFSSFCYRIEAIRILGRILAVSGNLDAHDDKVESVDSSLASWFHHLPTSKTEVVNNEGVVDEMLFQAHFIIHCASIYLHFPRSNFLSSPAATADVNSARRSCQRPCASPASSHHAHAVKAVKAANELSNLASLRLPVNKHTPFFVCGLVLSALVQVSACSDRNSGSLDQHRDRIVLAVGVLRSLGQTWAVARRMMQQVKTVANDIPELGMRTPLAQTPAPNEMDFNTFLSNDMWLTGMPPVSAAGSDLTNTPIL